MQVSLNNTYYAGLSAMQVGQSRVDQAASQIASAGAGGEVSGRSQSSTVQLERLRGTDRANQSDLASSLAEMAEGKFQVQAGAKVEKAADQRLGTLIDTFA